MVTLSWLTLTLVLATGFMVSLSVFMVWIAPSVVAEIKKKKLPGSWQKNLSKTRSTSEEPTCSKQKKKESLADSWE